MSVAFVVEICFALFGDGVYKSTDGGKTQTKLIPLGEVVSRAKEIDSSRTAILHCKGGVRSAKAIAALKESGFTGRLVNLKGGITAWSDEVDASVPKY